MDPGALSETLKAFAPFIDPNVDPAPPEPMNAAEQDVPQLDPQTVTTQQPSVPRPEPRAVDVPARLQDKIAEVEFADVPLKHFLRFVMNFSTIPVSVDPDALALVRATPHSKINVRKADATIDQLLAAALGPLQLTHLAVDQQLVVTRPPLADGGLRTHSHGVSDLVGNDPQSLTQLADLIVELVEPSSWEAAGGPGVIREELPSLVIQQRETILFRAIVFCDRLRAARGLPPQSKFDPELFSLEPRLARAAPRLAKPVTLNFPQPASFARILDRLSDEGGVEILVDWQALVQLGWTPDTETTVTANQRPLGEVLTEMLQPMDLTYRVIDAASVQVTTPAAAEARWDIEFYPVPKSPAAGQTPDALVTQVRNELTGGNPGALVGALHFDAPSRHLIAALPQSQQRKLAALVKGWGQTTLSRLAQILVGHQHFVQVSARVSRARFRSPGAKLAASAPHLPATARYRLTPPSSHRERVHLGMQFPAHTNRRTQVDAQLGISHQVSLPRTRGCERRQARSMDKRPIYRPTFRPGLSEVCRKNRN